jgi:hypothetical protein
MICPQLDLQAGLPARLPQANSNMIGGGKITMKYNS